MSAEWAEVLATFEGHLRCSDRKWATSKQYLQHLGWLAESFDDPGPWAISSGQLSEWLDSRGWSTATRRNVLVSLRTFYSWAVHDGRIEWAPTAGLPSSAVIPRGPRKKDLPPRWRQPVADFVTWSRASGRAEQTLVTRVDILRLLSQYAADPWTLTTEQLAQWLSNPDWSPETRRNRRATLTVFYRWAVAVNRIEASPALLLDSVLCPRALPRPTPDAALRAALAAADDRVRLALLLAGLAGLRRSEIVTLHTSQIAETHLFVTGKGGHHRIVPLHPDLGLELRAELGRRGDGRHGSGWRGRFVSVPGYLFPSDLHPGPMTPAHLGKLISRALPDAWTTHTLRHRFATAAYAAERDLRAVQDLLGHSRPESTARYAAVPDGAKVAAVQAVGIARW